MSVELECFKKHVSLAPFQIGLDDAHWGFEKDNGFDTWPHVFLWVGVACKSGSPDKYVFRFDLTNYPAKAPTACPWNVASNTILDPGKWPKGKQLVGKVFNPNWKPATNTVALYAPCDREAMEGHDQWANVHKDLWWKPDFTILKYLDFLYKILNSSDYKNG